MKNFIFAFSFFIAAALVVSAQSTDDFKRTEFFAGYSNGQVDTGIDSGSSAVDFFRDRESFNGFNVSGVYNLTRYFGIKGDVSGTYNAKRFNASADVGGSLASISIKNNSSFYNFLGGVQVADNARSGRFKPFAHAMTGALMAARKSAITRVLHQTSVRRYLYQTQPLARRSCEYSAEALTSG